MKKINKSIVVDKAFSLIELSIVILIIGILVAGVTSSSRLITRMKLITAQNLTRNSPIYSIKDLSVWWETSLDESFDNAEESDDSLISGWLDINPQSSSKINALQPAVGNKPKYKANIFNGLPGILFNGSTNFLLANSVGINGKGLTIFLVAKRNAYSSPSGIISGLPVGEINDYNPGCFQTFYDQNSAQYFTVSTNTWFSVVSQPSPADNTPFISSTIFNGSNNISYLNTFVGTTVSGSPTFLVDRIYIGSRYTGNTVNSYFNGYIAEIIIFNRGINTEERLAVTAYLSRKYNIKAS